MLNEKNECICLEGFEENSDGECDEIGKKSVKEGSDNENKCEKK